MAIIFGVIGVLVAIFGRGVADSIDFSNCSPDYMVTEVDIEGCKVIPCVLEIGGTYALNMTIEPSFTTDRLTQEVYITIYSVQMPIDIRPDNPCAAIQCPVQVSNPSTFRGSMFIKNELIPAKGMLWWKMRNDDGQTVVCMKTTVMVTRKKHFLFPRSNINY